MHCSSPGRDEKAVFRGLNFKSRDSLSVLEPSIVALSVLLRFVKDLVQDRRGQDALNSYFHPPLL